MHALKEPDPEPLLPLALAPESDGLLPHAVRARAAAATLVSTTPVRFICTDFILSRWARSLVGSGVLRPARRPCVLLAGSNVAPRRGARARATRCRRAGAQRTRRPPQGCGTG